MKSFGARPWESDLRRLRDPASINRRPALRQHFGEGCCGNGQVKGGEHLGAAWMFRSDLLQLAP